ncbi:hypothetical protein ACHAXT_005550 [Thalassiosira profunda]
MSFSRAARAAVAATPSAAFISTNAAVDCRIRASAVEELRRHFWEAFAARSSKRGASADNVATLSQTNSSVASDNDTRLSQLEEVQDKDRVLRKYARDDAFRHFRMSAAARAMKRGDGIMSNDFTNDFSLGLGYQAPTNDGDDAFCKESPSLIDVATAAQAREEMRCHFWASHRARKEAQDQEDLQVRRPIAPPLASSTPSHRNDHHLHEHLHEHRFPLPSSLQEVYHEFGGPMLGIQHQPRAMAITEVNPPFRLVAVNKEWTSLCGYTREEAVGSTLKQLLQGSETNAVVAKDLVESLLHNGHEDVEKEAVLVNYRNDGRSFRNHVRVGRIKNEQGDTTHFVGVFRKISDRELGTECDEDLFANV